MKRAFTLIELLVSMTGLSILLLVCASVLDQSRRTWSQARARVDQFRSCQLVRTLADDADLKSGVADGAVWVNVFPKPPQAEAEAPAASEATDAAPAHQTQDWVFSPL